MSTNSRCFALAVVLVVVQFYGCSDSSVNSGSGGISVMPGPGSVFHYTQLSSPGAFGGFDTITVTDSVIESGVLLGSHRNVLHVLRSVNDGFTPPEDVFYNFESSGDVTQQVGSLAFPDQSIWVPYPVYTHQPWNGLVMDSTLNVQGEQIHELMYDTVSFLGSGFADVQGKLLQTSRIKMLLAATATTTDPSSGGLLTQTINIIRNVDFAPSIGYFTLDQEISSALDSSALTETQTMTLTSYTLK
ncbi:MAG: hypothetical protein JSS75_06785 [Bacteroidetes bacterium]|nr:hypothetical protein [Bacteroidota bacterium]